MLFKRIIPSVTLIFLFYASACKRNEDPAPLQVRIANIGTLGDFKYENNLLKSIGNYRLHYDHQQQLTAMIRHERDTLYTSLGVRSDTIIREEYIQYSFSWDSGNVYGIIIDSTFSSSSTNGYSTMASYSKNTPLLSFFYTGDKIDSILCHAPSEFNGLSKMAFEYDDNHNIFRKTTYGMSPSVIPYQRRYYTEVSTLDYDQRNNPFHLLFKQLGTILPQLIHENFSPNNPVKQTTNYTDGPIKLDFEAKFSYMYNASGYPNQIVSNAETSSQRSKSIRYE